MHSFINKLTNSTVQTTWPQQNNVQPVQLANDPNQPYIPQGTYTPGTPIQVGQHSITIESYLAEGTSPPSFFFSSPFGYYVTCISHTSCEHGWREKVLVHY